METIYDREWAAQAAARMERDLWGDDDRAPRVVVVAVEGGWIVRTEKRVDKVTETMTLEDFDDMYATQTA